MTDSAGKIVDSSILTAEARAALEGVRALAAHLVVVLHDPDTDDATHERVCRILIDMGASAVVPLVEAICVDPKRGRDDAAAILCEIGEAAVEPVIGCLDHRDPEVRATAAFLFTGLHDALGRAHRPLMRLLDDPDELVRQSAAYALGALECRSAVPKLIALATRPLQMPSREVSSEAWAEAYPYDSCAAVDALGQLGDLRAVRPLIFLVESQGPDGPMYDETVRALGLLGDVRAAHIVHSAFEDGRSEGAFAEALAAMQGRAALDDLLELAGSEEPHVRRAVATDLVRLGSPAAAEAVAALLVDGDEGVRSTAREALAWTVDEETAEEIIAGLEDRSPEVRAWTTRLLPLTCAWSD